MSLRSEGFEHPRIGVDRARAHQQARCGVEVVEDRGLVVEPGELGEVGFHARDVIRPSAAGRSASAGRGSTPRLLPLVSGEAGGATDFCRVPVPRLARSAQAPALGPARLGLLALRRPRTPVFDPGVVDLYGYPSEAGSPSWTLPGVVHPPRVSVPGIRRDRVPHEIRNRGS